MPALRPLPHATPTTLPSVRELVTLVHGITGEPTLRAAIVRLERDSRPLLRLTDALCVWLDWPRRIVWSIMGRATEAVHELVIAVATWIGLIVGVAVGGGGISLVHITAVALQLGFFGLATGAVALALGVGTGRRSLAGGGAAAVAILGWLVNSFAPLVGAIAWLKYLTLFYYYAGNDPLTRGVDVTGLVVLGTVTLVLTAVAVVAFDRRDVRA
jgi:hypothetical protein